MKKILLQVDQKARDLASVLLVGEYLNEFGIRASYCNKANMLAACETVKPDVLVLSCSEGQYKDLACYVAPHCKIVLMTQEGACATKESTVLRHTMHGMGLETYIKGLSRVYLWSEISKKWLLEEGVYPESILRVFGTSRLDSYRQLQKRNYNTTRKIRVGFANRGGSINPAIKQNQIQAIDEARSMTGSHRAYLDQNREWEDWIWHSMASLRVNFDLIELLASKAQYEIIFRPDPYENYKSYDYLKKKYPCFQINTDPILANFIDEIDVLVTEFSTTGVEAFLVKKPVISTQKIIGPRLPEHNRKENHLNPSHMKCYWQPKDKDEFLKILQETVTNSIPYSPEPELAASYHKNFYNWPSEGKSVAYQIAEDLKQLCNESKSSDMIKLHQAEYREHPFIERLARRTHFPRWFIRRAVLKPYIFDVLSIYRSFKRGDLPCHMRMEYYSWNWKDKKIMRNVFQKLKQKDLEFIRTT
jgi:surface carbohydrate biosynthesis protein